MSKPLTTDLVDETLKDWMDGPYGDSLRKAYGEPPFRVGAVVTLASGGPQMTVATIGSRGGVTIAKVVWVDEMGKEHEYTLDARCLCGVVTAKPEDE